MSTSKAKSERFKHAPHAAWRKVGDETIILDLNTSIYYSLNDTGAFVWERLGAGDAVPEAVSALSEAFEVSASTAASDVAEVVADLAKEKLLLPA